MIEMTGEDSKVAAGAGLPAGDARNGGPLKILYASGLSPNDSSLYRLWALQRLGHTVVPARPPPRAPRGSIATWCGWQSRRNPT
jgi:hypothetical protein